MASWRERFEERRKTPSQAIGLIRPGERIFIGSGAAEPSVLVDALVEEGQHLRGNEIVHILTLGHAPYVAPGLEERFRHNAFFIGANVRQAVQEGRADFTPIFLSDIPELLRSEHGRVNVAVIRVSPPDAHGFMSLGVSVDVVRAGVEAARIVIAEVNPNMPRTHGASFISVNDVDAWVETKEPVPELPAPTMDPITAAIGRHVALLIKDGDTIQVGIGKIPNAVLGELEHRRDLGVHTEMFSDGIMNLVRQGAITGKRKSLLPGKIVTSFVMGSRKLYDWVDDNPVVEMRPSDFTNDPQIIARNDNMISVNSAIAVDLTGQVAADTLKGQFFSGIGGQVDFVRGASRSKGGKAIIALPATAAGGKVSRIVPTLEAGAGVVTSRGDVHFVVTEHGVADLWGRPVRQRAEALIAIAHPDFREELRAQAVDQRYLT